MRRLTAAVFAVLVVVSGVGPGIVGVASATPSGHVSVPAGNISDDLPSDYAGDLRASDLEGGTSTTAHADTLEIYVTTPSRAGAYLGQDAAAIGGSETVLVLRDSQNHAGREVALPATAVRQAIGRLPSRVWGTHDDGKEWSSKAYVDGDSYVFSVPEFSTNVVSFAGEVEYSGSGVESGKNYKYNVTDLDAVENVSASIEGVASTETDTESWSGVTSGSSLSTSVAGNVDPRGPNASSPVLTIAGSEQTSGAWWTGSSSTDESITVGGNAPPRNSEVTFTGRESLTSSSWSATSQSDGENTSISVGGNVPPENAEVTFSGNGFGTQYDNLSQTGMSPSGSVSLSVEGSLEPTDGSGNDPKLRVTGFKSGYDVGTASLSKSQDVSGQDSTMMGLTFADNGTKMYAAGNNNDNIYQYSLSTAYDVSSASYSKSFDVSGQTSQPYDVAFSDDGTRMFVVGGGGNVHQYSLSTAYDVGTASHSKSASVNTERGVTFSPDGTEMYTTGLSTTVHQYSLSTAFDVGSVSSTTSVDVSGQTSDPTEVSISNDGTKLFIVDRQNGYVYQYSLSTAFDVQSASYSKSTDVYLEDGSPAGLAFSSDGMKMYMVGYDTNTVYQYSVPGNPTNVQVSDGAGTTVSYGSFSDGETKTKSIPLTTSSTKLDFSADSGESLDIELTMQEHDYVENPSIDVDGDGTADASYSGWLSSGQTATATVSSLSTGTSTVTTSVIGAPVDWTLTADEVVATKDPFIDITGDGVADASHDGILRSGETATVSLSGLETGAVTVSSTSASSTPVDWRVDTTEVLVTEDPSIDVNGDGVADASHDGTLAAGEQVNQTLANLTLSSSALNVTTASDSQVDLTLRTIEIVETPNASLTLNGEQTWTGSQLGPGEDQSLTIPESAFQEGENNLTVQIDTSGLSQDAPAARANFSFSHAAVDQRSVSYDSGAWYESYNASRTYANDRDGASFLVRFKNDVISIQSVSVGINGSEPSQISSGSYTLSGNDLRVDLDEAYGGDGTIPAGTSFRVIAEGARVDVINGSIEVTDPTMFGQTLDTQIEVTSASSGFGIDVSDSPSSPRVHYAAEESWQSPDDFVLLDQHGDQVLRLPYATAGSTASIRTIPTTVRPESSEVEARVDDPAEPRFSLEPHGATPQTVKIKKLDATTGTVYTLRSVTDDQDVLVAEAVDGTVTFSAPGEAQTYRIVESDGSSGTSGIPPAVAGAASDSTGIPVGILSLMGGVVVAVLAFFYVSRRLGASGIRDNALLLVGSLVVSGLGVWALVPDVVITEFFIDLFGTSGSIPALFGGIVEFVASSGVGTVLLGAAVLIALYLVNRVVSLPRYLNLALGVVVGLWLIDGVTGGALSGGLSEISALVWLLAIGGTIALLWRALQPTIVNIGGGK